MKTEVSRKDVEVVKIEMGKGFLMACRFCEFKKCCKKYKHGKRCKKCPKKD